MMVHDNLTPESGWQLRERATAAGATLLALKKGTTAEIALA
jgi:hypothetical protein